MEVKWDGTNVSIYKPSFANPVGVAHIALWSQKATFIRFDGAPAAVDIPISEAIERLVRL